MTFAKSEALVARLGRPVRGRVALALSHAISDSQTRPHVVPFGSSKIKGSVPGDYFTKLLEGEGCKDAWEKYTSVKEDNGFAVQLAQGTAPLNGFRHYTLQDAMYLEYYVRVKMAAFVSLGSKTSSDDLRDFVAKIPHGLDYSDSSKSVCQYQLGVPGDDIDKEWKVKSDQLKTSVEHYEKVISDAIGKEKEHPELDSWLDIHFALLPCIKGYYEISKPLLEDPATVRNTPYYSLWIQANADESYVQDYNKFITDNIGNPTKEQWENWQNIFRISCDNEREFFNLAIKDYDKYDILKEGDVNYHISPFVNGGVFLAVDKGKVQTSNTGVSWQLINSKDGYSIKFGDQQFLGVGDDGRSVVIKADDSKNGTTQWSINPVFIPGKNTYQLFPSKAIQHALDFDKNTVSVADNNLTTQTWILTKV